MLNDPEFAKNVKWLERMLRVRQSACLGLAKSGSSGILVVAGCENHAVSTVSESQRGAVWSPRASGGTNSAEDAVLETCGRENDAVFTVSESRGGHDIVEDAGSREFFCSHGVRVFAFLEGRGVGDLWSREFFCSHGVRVFAFREGR